MTILTKANKINDLSNQQTINTIKYGNGVSRTFSGEALYLPKLRYNGDGILDSIGSFLINNKDNINAIANTVGTVNESVGKVAGTTINIVRKALELKNQGLSNETAEEILKKKIKIGSGFYYIK